MTKAFTAAAVGELIAENKAKWDAPVSEYLPEFKLKDPRLTAEINFIDLLAHRTVSIRHALLGWRGVIQMRTLINTHHLCRYYISLSINTPGLRWAGL